ncbi:copper resistance protein CopC [Streptomyces sp. HMX87]|uniref:copper resistance CopC/CopD family protein n=1 Tax=Streptomyces sp. HMX87 TaxID=3390849 RepID=UPI003A843DBD
MLLGVALVLLLLGGTGPASAHATLTSSDPADGTVLDRAPRRLTLAFTESVGLRDDSFRVLDPDGHRLRLGEAGHAGDRSDTARVTLPGGLGEGTYTVAWRVVSADSHPVSGAFTFSVGRPSATTASADTGPTEDPLTKGLHTGARYLAYLAAALLIGAAAFALLCRPPDPAVLRRPLAAAWWTLLAATVSLLALRAPYEAGTGPTAALDAGALGDTLTSRPGVLLAVRVGLLMSAAVFLAGVARGAGRVDGASPAAETGRAAPALETGRGTPAGGAVLAAGGVLAVPLALTWAAAEHAAAGIQVPVAMASAVLHLLATAVWLGGLVALLLVLRRSTPTAPLPAAVVARFSRTAFASVTVLVVTGVYQSWRGLGSWTALTGTSYGRLLLAKLGAVAVLLAAAALSRRWTARLVTADARTVVPARERVPELVGAPPLPLEPDPEPEPYPEPDPEPDRDRGRDRKRDRRPDPARKPDPAADADPAPEPSPAPAPESGSAPPGEPRPPHVHRRALRRSVLVEAAVAVVVLLVTSLLTSTVPGRAEAEAARAAPAGALPPASVTTIPFDVGVPGGRGRMQITLDPGRTGDNAVEAVVFTAQGGLTSVPELRLSFTLPDKDIGPIDAELVDRGGYWSANALTLPLPGDWRMKATVRVSEVDQASESRQVRIRP